jgi:hypothetical protein
LDNAECEELPVRFRQVCEAAVIREAKIGIAEADNTEFRIQNLVGGTGHYLNRTTEPAGGVLELLRQSHR